MLVYNTLIIKIFWKNPTKRKQTKRTISENVKSSSDNIHNLYSKTHPSSSDANSK